MQREPSELDFLFDSYGWVRNDAHHRYELDLDGEVIAAIQFNEARLAEKVDGYDLTVLLDQAAERYEELQRRKTLHA